MKLMQTCALALMIAAGTAHAAFEGRDSSGAANSTCTASGILKCTYFYDTNLDITILNNWNIGTGFWSPSAAPGSAQALVKSVGFSASGLTGWVLPTGDDYVVAGTSSEYLSIWRSVGATFAGLSTQFDGVQTGVSAYWSGTESAQSPGNAWGFVPIDGHRGISSEFFALYAVAVRPGDLAAVSAVPEPESWVVMLAGLMALGFAKRRNAR